MQTGIVSVPTYPEMKLFITEPISRSRLRSKVFPTGSGAWKPKNPLLSKRSRASISSGVLPSVTVKKRLITAYYDLQANDFFGT